MNERKLEKWIKLVAALGTIFLVLKELLEQRKSEAGDETNDKG
jgi:hypothetical protein